MSLSGKQSTSIYISRAQLLSATDVEALATGGSVRQEANPAGGWSRLVVSWPGVKLTLNEMGDAGGELAGHLDGFTGYVHNLAGDKMDASVFDLILKIQRSRHVVGVTADPAFDKEGRAEKFVRALAQRERAIVFLNPAVGDSELRVLLGPGNARDKGAVVPVFESAVKRKARSEAKLKARGTVVSASLPPIAGDDELYLRAPRDVSRRAMALMVVAMRGEGLEQDKALGILKDQKLLDVLSPKEKAYLDNKSPTKQDNIQMCWRYECLWVLLWSLGYVEKLEMPGSPCDAAKTVKIIRDNLAKGFIENAKLRPASEILDAADLVYRCHWAVVNARQKKQPVPQGLDAGVAAEWHYALNWLIRYMNQDWDDVSPDT